MDTTACVGGRRVEWSEMYFNNSTKAQLCARDVRALVCINAVIGRSEGKEYFRSEVITEIILNTGT